MGEVRLAGLAGAIGAGKSTFARRLKVAHGFQIVSFGDAIKDEVAQFLPKTLRAYCNAAYPGVDRTTDSGYAGWIHRLLWQYRDEVSRALLQEWGMMRRAQRADYWVQAWLLRAREHPCVVNDNVRMRGEAEAIRGLGGRLIKLFRPEGLAVPPLVADDPTERGLDDWADWDAVVANDGSLADLEAKADECVTLFWG